ncbi:hypothetical protein Vi05172_g10841 [Venturia inaequalis]|nr:hypothetical protein Vi05172_g10841 [Venturia inaequalis]
MASWTPINGHQRQLDKNELEARQQVETQQEEAASNLEREPATSTVDEQNVRSEATPSQLEITPNTPKEASSMANTKANVKRQTPGLDGDAEEDSKPKAKRIRKGKAPAKPRGPVKPSSAAKQKDAKADVNARRRAQAAEQDAKDAEDLPKEKRPEAMEKVAEMLKENPMRVFTSDRTEFADALGTGSKGIAQLKDEYKQLRQEDRQTTGIMKDWDKKSSSSEESDADEVPIPTKPGSSKTSIPVIDFTHFPDPIMEDWTVILAEVQAIFQAKGKRKRHELHEMWPAYFNKTRGYLLRSYWDNLFLLTDSKGNRLLPMEVCKWMNNDKTGYERWEEQHLDEFTANSKAMPRSRAKPLLKTATDPGKGTVISKEVRKVPLTKPGQFSGCSETYTGDQGLIDPYDLELACQYARLIISAHGWRTIACALITNTLGKVLRGDIKPEKDSKTMTQKQRAFVDKGIATLVFEQAAFQDHKEHFAKRVKAELKKSIAKSDEFLKAQWDFKVQKLERENAAMRKLLNIAEDGDIPGMSPTVPSTATEKAKEVAQKGAQLDEAEPIKIPTVKKIQPRPAAVTEARTSKGAMPPSAAEISYETNATDPGVPAIQRKEIATRGELEKQKARMGTEIRRLPTVAGTEVETQEQANSDGAGDSGTAQGTQQKTTIMHTADNSGTTNQGHDSEPDQEQKLLETFQEFIHKDSYVESTNTKAMKEWAETSAQQNDIDAEDAEAIVDMVRRLKEKNEHEMETECPMADISTTKA